MTKPRTILFAVFYLAPAIVLGLMDRHEAILRLIIICTLLTLGQVLLLRAALDRRVTFIKPEGKLADSPYKQRIELLLRGLTALFAVILTIYVAVPLWGDTYRWGANTKAPDKIVARVVDNYTVFGTWFLYQKLAVIDSPGSARKEFYLLYSPRAIRVGQVYDITFLEKSRMVLMAEHE